MLDTPPKSRGGEGATSIPLGMGKNFRHRRSFRLAPSDRGIRHSFCDSFSPRIPGAGHPPRRGPKHCSAETSVVRPTRLRAASSSERGMSGWEGELPFDLSFFFESLFVIEGDSFLSWGGRRPAPDSAGRRMSR